MVRSLAAPSVPLHVTREIRPLAVAAQVAAAFVQVRGDVHCGNEVAARELEPVVPLDVEGDGEGVRGVEGLTEPVLRGGRGNVSLPQGYNQGVALCAAVSMQTS